MDVNDVKAGKYQLIAVRWDEITSKPGDPLEYVRHRRGDIVDLNAADARRLVKAGAVVKPGELEKAAAEQARLAAEQAAAAYQAILDTLPDDVRAEIAPDSTLQEPKPGTADYILAEVGTDKALAQAALDKENAEEKPRKGLVASLEKIVAGDGS